MANKRKIYRNATSMITIINPLLMLRIECSHLQVGLWMVTFFNRTSFKGRCLWFTSTFTSTHCSTTPLVTNEPNFTFPGVRATQIVGMITTWITALARTTRRLRHTHHEVQRCRRLLSNQTPHSPVHLDADCSMNEYYVKCMLEACL